MAAAAAAAANRPAPGAGDRAATGRARAIPRQKPTRPAHPQYSFREQDVDMYYMIIECKGMRVRVRGEDAPPPLPGLMRCSLHDGFVHPRAYGGQLHDAYLRLMVYDASVALYIV